MSYTVNQLSLKVKSVCLLRNLADLEPNLVDLEPYLVDLEPYLLITSVELTEFN